MTQKQAETNYRILAIDDNESNLKVLKLILEKEGYAVDTISNGFDAMPAIRSNRPDLILLDVLMPDIDGFEICREVKSIEYLRRTPIIIISALNQLEDKLKGIELGADEFLTKPINKRELLTRVKNLLKYKAMDSQLENSRNVIMSFAFAVDINNPLRKGHSQRVGMYSTECARAMGLSRDDVQEIEFGAYLHDIGMIGVPSQIVMKSDPMTEEEYEIYKKHPSFGYEICAPLEAIGKSMAIVLHHHERFNGTGYPDGIAGDQIPLGARIVAVADSYDIMTHGLLDRNPITASEASEIIKADSGSKYDPEVVRHFLSLPLADIERLAKVKMFSAN